MPGNFPSGDLAQGDRHYHAPDLYAYLSHHGVSRRKNALFTYSNLGFGILSQALANRTGVSYPELLRREVTAPLGLRDTTVRLSPEQQARLIPGHNKKHEAVPAWNLDAFAGAGGLRSTAGDLLTYLQANLHPDRLASANPALAAALSESHKLRAAADPGTRIALAWFYHPDTGTYFHSGVTGGYASYAFFHPQGDYAGVVLLNSGPSFSNDCVVLGEHIRQRLAGEPALSLVISFIPARSGFGGFLRSFLAYWITMFLAGTFTFCCVLGLQGLAAQLPRRYFPRVSSFLQFAVVCALMGVYFLQPSAGTPSLIRAQGNGLLSWSPSFWFLGLYQQLSGSPALTPLAHKAWAGLVAAICVAGLVYTRPYFRNFPQMAEEPAIFPDPCGVRFLLASYAGMAFAVDSFLLRSPAARELFKVSVVDPRHQVNTPLLASTALTMTFAVIGLRVAFSLPTDLGAKGISRVTPGLLWTGAVIPVWAGSAVLLLSVWPRQAALSHLAILGFWGTALVELCLPGYRMISFTRSFLPGRSNFHIMLIVCTSFFLLAVVEAAGLERRALQNPTHVGIAVLLLASVAALANQYRGGSPGGRVFQRR